MTTEQQMANGWAADKEYYITYWIHYQILNPEM